MDSVADVCNYVNVYTLIGNTATVEQFIASTWESQSSE